MDPKLKARELRQEKADVWASAKALITKAEGENRDLNTEEQAAFDKMNAAIESLGQRIDRLESMGDSDDTDDDDDANGDDRDADSDADNGDDDSQDDEDDDQEGDDENDRARNRFGRRARKQRRSFPRPGGQAAGKKLERKPGESDSEYATRCRRSSADYRSAWNSFLLNGVMGLQGSRHMRALQADSDLLGGYMVAPLEFVAQLIKFKDNYVYVRSKATKFTLSAAQSLGAPSLDTDISDADWTSELATGNEDTSMVFGKRELTPYPLAKRIKISNKLLRLSVLNADQIVQDRLAYKFAVSEEKAFLTGNGVGQPLGLFTASSRGISTARDVQTGSSTGITADGLIAAKYALKAQYQQTAEWFFHRDALKMIRQLKDNYGQYLWQPGLASGAPDTLLDRPINMSEYVPNTFTTGLYVGGLFDLEHYWIADSETMQLQRLLELYAEANQVGFICRQEIDGMPVLEEAFIRLITN